MAKHQGLNFSLGTRAIAIVLFAVILAFGATDSTGKDVLGATAAYAAVLVVFISTSLSAPRGVSSSTTANDTKVSIPA
jgi:uncharacterized membrane protein